MNPNAAKMKNLTNFFSNFLLLQASRRFTNELFGNTIYTHTIRSEKEKKNNSEIPEGTHHWIHQACTAVIIHRYKRIIAIIVFLMYNKRIY